MAGKSKKQRRNQRTRSEQWREQVESAEAATPVGDTPRPSLRDLAPPPEPTGPAYPGTRFAALLTATFISAAATIQMGAPVLGHTWNLAWLIPGAALTALLGWWTWWSSAWVSARRALLAATAATICLGLFGLAAATSVVIDGQPQFANSPTARAYNEAQSILTDLQVMAENDRLLGYDESDARVRADQYTPAAEEMEKIAQRYATQEDHVSERFALTSDLMQSAAHFGALALETRSQVIRTPDAALEAELAQLRTQFVTAWSQAAESLREASDEFGFDPGPADEGIRE